MGLGYFVVADTKNLRYKINPNKEPTPELIKKYRFFGKFVGKAVFERIPLNLYFDRCLIKHMIDACIVLDDIKYIDEDVLLFFP
jgi:HECT-domain (ubiquitin-transferase)